MMITKRIQRRNEAILRYHRKGYGSRAIGRIVHLSHGRVCQIVNEVESKSKLVEYAEAKLNLT